jgi:prevent-host-death family protein
LSVDTLEPPGTARVEGGCGLQPKPPDELAQFLDQTLRHARECFSEATAQCVSGWCAPDTDDATLIVFYTVFCTVWVMTIFADAHTERTLSVTAASGRGVAGLVKDAEHGDDIIVERHGRAVAAVVSIDHLDEIRRVRADLTAAALVLSRELADTGNRTDLNDAIAAFGFDRSELEAELAADLAAGRG